MTDALNTTVTAQVGSHETNPRSSADTTGLRRLFADHYWNNFEGDKDLILKHVDFVLSATVSNTPEGR